MADDPLDEIREQNRLLDEKQEARRRLATGNQDSILRAYETGAAKPILRVVGSQEHDVAMPLKLLPAELPDPHTIPPREWLYGSYLVRGYVTVLVSPGGTGKSALSMGIALELVTNRKLLGNNIFSRVNAAIFNLDDPMQELNRRIAALMIHHRIRRDELVGRLFLHDGEGRGLKLASIDEDGFTIAYPDEQALINEIIANDIGIVVCDPFAESHSLEENSNPHMVQAAAAWRRVARATNCAVLLVHHVRKGEIAGIDSARGAKALTDSARAGLLLSTMTPADAEEFGIQEDARLSYVRLDDAKRNMAPAQKARWFRLESVELGNTHNPTYPNGDNVAAIAAWKPPESDLAKAPAKELRTVLAAIEAGPEPGIRYTKTRRGDSARWCGTVIMQAFDVSEKQATKQIEAWFRSKLLFETDYQHPKWRRTTKGVAARNNNWPD